MRERRTLFPSRNHRPASDEMREALGRRAWMEPLSRGEAVEAMTGDDRVESVRAGAVVCDPQVAIVDFGDWGGASLLAEYDAECDTIRVNSRAVERVRATAGAAEAALFVESAIAHERFHRANPGASEAAAHDNVRGVIGGDPRRFEACARGALPERS